MMLYNHVTIAGDYQGPMSSEEFVYQPTGDSYAIPLGYFIVSRTELTQLGDLSWHPIKNMWCTGSMVPGNRVRNFHCVVRKKPKNKVTIE